jgi:PAS domain S-box-containing protein
VYVEGAVEDQSEEQEARDVHGRAAQFQWVFSESGLAIVTMDLLGAVLDANPAFLRSFGYELEQLRGTPLSRLAEAEDRADLEDELARTATGAADVSEAQRRFTAADGGVLWARTRTGLVRSFKGHPDHLIILLEEVAEA